MSTNEANDPIAARALALLELAAIYASIKDDDIRDRMRMAMDLINESIDRVIYPQGRKGPATLKSV